MTRRRIDKPRLPASSAGTRAAALLVALSAGAATLGGCSTDELFGSGRGVTVDASTPSGKQQGEVTLRYTLAHATIASTDVSVLYSTNGGASFSEATAGAGGDGTEGLVVSEDGETYDFVWDSSQDLGGGRFDDVRVRISPSEGRSTTSDGFAVHNAVFAVAAREAGTSGDTRATLVDVDMTDGRVSVLGSVDPGGSDPGPVIYTDDHFYVANAGSDDIAVVALDRDAGSISVVPSSPFDAGGNEPRYLATDGDSIFVSNVGDDSITVLDIVETDGVVSLERDTSAGATVSGCRGLAVRAGRLYVARFDVGEIVVLDIEDGELELNAFTPIAATGLVDPVVVVVSSVRLYAVNSASSTLVGFRFLAGGDLLPIAGSPFSFSDAGVTHAATLSGVRLALSSGDASSVGVLELDANGVPAENSSSPVATAGPATAALLTGDVVVVATGTGETLESYILLDDGTLTTAEDSPVDLGGVVTGIASGN